MKPPPPHFSVITPILNGLRDIPGYVETLQSQSCRDWEAIVVDDGSSDDGIELLQRLTTGDTRFRLTRNTLPRQIPGPYQARNVGLSLARGRFVCFLDIDDRWLSHKLQSQITRLRHNPEIKLLYSAYIRARIGATSGRIRPAPPLMTPQHWIKITNPVPMLTACVHSEAIAGLHFEAQHHEDYLFWHAVLQRLKPSQIADDRAPLAIYGIHTASISSNKLQATVWIWRCYRKLGYSRAVAVAAMLTRGLLQAWLLWCESTTPPIKLLSRRDEQATQGSNGLCGTARESETGKRH